MMVRSQRDLVCTELRWRVCYDVWCRGNKLVGEYKYWAVSLRELVARPEISNWWVEAILRLVE